MARVDGYAFVPLKVRCSMKWATPTWPSASSREPARTYAAIETERAAGSRALITRGPASSTVRSNIRPMVQESNGRPGRRPGRPGTLQPNRWLADDRLDPVLGEVDEEGDRDRPHQRMDLAHLASDDLEQDPADETGTDA